MCTASHHVAEGCIALLPGSRLLACAAGMVMVDVTVMGPTIDGVVVELSGPGWLRLALVIAAVVGAWGWCWCRWCCQVLGCQGLGNALLDHGAHVRGRWNDGWVGDNAGEGDFVGDSRRGYDTLLQLFDQ